MTQSFVLVVVLLTTQSSYKDNVERPAAGVPDTVQFWLTPGEDWRIRTFAIDHDAHVHTIRAKEKQRTFGPDAAVESTRKNYGDVIARIVRLEIADPSNQAEVTRLLKAQGLTGTLEISPSGLAFYNPDGGRYRTQSEPR